MATLNSSFSGSECSDSCEDFTVNSNHERSRVERVRTVPTRYYGGSTSRQDLAASTANKQMTVICNQTGKKIFVKASDLHVSKVISTKDLKTGAQLILQEDGVPLQVTLINENKIVGQKSKNTQRNAEKVTPLVKNETNRVLSLASDEDYVQCQANCLRIFLKFETMDVNPAVKRKFDDGLDITDASKCVDVHVNPAKKRRLQDGEPDKSIQKDIQRRLISIEDKMDKIFEAVQSFLEQVEGTENSDKLNDCFMHNGTNMLEIQANDAYAYARRLLDFLFSKEEQKKSLVHSSLKSKKPQLDQGRMSKLFACVKKQYAGQFSMKELCKSLNQKCRDAKPVTQTIVID